MILNLPIFIQDFVFARSWTSETILSVGVYNFYSGGITILFFCVATHFLLSNFPRVKFFLQMLIVIFSAIFFVTDIFLLYKFGVILQRQLIQIVLDTNFNEAKEFFQTYVLDFKVIFGTATIILLIALTAKRLRIILQNMSEKNLRLMSFCVLINLLPEFSFLIYQILKVIFVQDFFGSTILGKNVHNICEAVQTSGKESEILAAMDAQDEKIISDNSKIPYVVLILGESATRNHMQLYGYNFENNPRLTLRLERGEIFKFNDVIACANSTREAMEKIFNFAEKDANDIWYTSPNIFDIVRRAGYHTFWISNQSPSDWWSNVEKIYSARCDEKF